MKRQHAFQIFASAVAAVQPEILLQQYIYVNKDCIVINGQAFSSSKKIYVTGAGKAAAAMAAAIEKILGNKITAGIVTTKYGHSLSLSHIKIIESAHPVPDENGVHAVNKTLELLQQVTKDDLLICLFSGGASALWCDLPPGITLHAMQAITNLLIKSGAPIHEINTVRKHISIIKGGQLIHYCNRAAVFSFIISDVVFDELDIIASGPAMPDLSTFRHAYTILDKYDLLSTLPENICIHFEKGVKGEISETPKPGNTLFQNVDNKIIGNNQLAVGAATVKAKQLGYHVCVIPHLITADTEAEAGKFLSSAIHYDDKKPVCILQGGETTVKVTGTGKGGRNQHFVLAALCALKKAGDENLLKRITILSGGTDGTDGPTDAAGAVLDYEIINTATQKNLSPELYLSNHDAYHFFKQVDGLFITGATQTNVMDMMIALID